MTTRPVRVAVIDSGVNPAHPHVGGAAGGVAVGADGVTSADYIDRMGHGTAVAAAIRERAPQAELFAVKVFDRQLSAPIEALVEAIDWAATRQVDLINLSLGTANQAHAAPLRSAVARAAQAGALLGPTTESAICPVVSRASSRWSSTGRVRDWRWMWCLGAERATRCVAPLATRDRRRACRRNATSKGSVSLWRT